VIVTTSSIDKAERLKRIGAIEVINRSIKPEWHREVLELTGPRGAVHIIEMAGGDNIERSLQALAFGGRISMVGLLEDDRLTAIRDRCRYWHEPGMPTALSHVRFHGQAGKTSTEDEHSKKPQAVGGGLEPPQIVGALRELTDRQF
jgi:NADPH:quinone reductase-like Zn-dependent oxidoreductase